MWLAIKSQLRQLTAPATDLTKTFPLMLPQGFRALPLRRSEQLRLIGRNARA